MRSTEGVDEIFEAMSRGCDGPYCGLKQAVLHGLRQMAGKRTVRLGVERDEKWKLGLRHSPGTVRAMEFGWSTPLHVDTFHSFAWNSLRREFCAGRQEKVTLGTSSAETLKYSVFTKKPFTASAILTLHSPDRESDPFDTRVYRTRWPAMMHNCSIRATESYGVGLRFARDTVPSHLLERPLRVSPRPGDFFIFNGEFLHDTPQISRGLRTVINSFVGMSDHEDDVVLFA